MRAALAVAVLAMVVGAAGLVTGAASGLQAQAVDLLQPGTERSEDVVIVSIDRQSVVAAGSPWPWPRAMHAELIDAIGAGDPAVIAYDVLFADERADDGRLVDAVRSNPVVLPVSLTLDAATSPPVVRSLVGTTSSLSEVASATGHANVTVSPGRGVVRSLPLYAVDRRGVPIPSLVLSAVAVADGATGPLVERPDGVQIGERLVPLDGAELGLNWAPGLAPDGAVSARRVLDGSVGPEHFRDRLVLVGVTEPTLGDLHLVPTDKSGGTAGLYVHANAANTILQRAFLEEAGTGSQVLALLVLAAVVAVVYATTALWLAGMVTVLSVALVFVWSSWRFHTGGELWNVVWPSITLVLVGLGGILVRYLAEIRHRRRASKLFAQYVPAAALEDLADPHALARATEGERVQVAVLFCDLRGFTPVAAELSPTRVRMLLDLFYAHVVDTVLDHRGTVMQFVGDEVFAVFGAPVPAPDDAERAIRCARTLVEEVGPLDVALGERGLPSVRFGVGVHLGEVLAAHAGPEHRRQYVAIGDAVNVGSRLCGQAGAGQVVVSTEVVEAAGGTGSEGFERMGPLELKGVPRDVEALRLTASQGSHESVLAARSTREPTASRCDPPPGQL